jgi:hypothetical protein
MLDPAETKLGGVETHADARKLRRPLPEAPRSHRGVLVCLPNFRRRKGRGRHAQARRASTCPCSCRPIPTNSTNSMSSAARRLLRQDFRLQQSPPGRHRVHLTDETCRASARRLVPRGPAENFAGCAGSSAACARCGSAPSARVPAPSIPCATPRRSSSATASASPPSISPKSSAPPPWIGERDARRRRQRSTRSKPTPMPRRCRRPNSHRWPAWGSCSMTSLPPNTSMPPPSSAGPPCRPTTAATSARR